MFPKTLLRLSAVIYTLIKNTKYKNKTTFTVIKYIDIISWLVIKALTKKEELILLKIGTKSTYCLKY